MSKSSLQIQLGQATDTGPKPVNEDFYGAIIPNEPNLSHKGIAVVIADGVSQSGAGKEASESCVKTFLFDYFSTPDSWSTKTSVGKVLTALNRWLYSKAQMLHTDFRGMASTLSILILKGRTAHLFHVGDSRIYLLRGGSLEQLTQDHRTWVSHDRHYLRRAMGVDLHLDIDYRTLPIEVGDQFILTTDGVHDSISDAQLRQLLQPSADANPLISDDLHDSRSDAPRPQRLQPSTDADLNQTAARIIEAAKVHSLDNLTCQLVRVLSLPPVQSEDLLSRISELPFPPLLSAGMSFEGHQILSEIHASNRTQIYLAREQKSQELRIIKTPSPNFADDTAFIERFLLEEWAGKRIHHPNVLNIIEPSRNKGCLYYLMEYVEGQTLRSWMQQNPQPEMSQVLAILKQLIAGVRAFHRLEMLHQDLKPENIMLSNEQRLVVLDFGSVRVSGINEALPQGLVEQVLGTRNYTAPEYFQSQPPSIGSDLFSIGVILYEMLTGGRLPYGEEANFSRPKLLKYHSACEHNPNIPIWIDSCLEKAVALDASQRYSSLSELQYDFEHPNLRLQRQTRPLIERDPLKFWQGIAMLSLLVNLVLILFILI